MIQLSANEQTNYPDSSVNAIQVSDTGSNTIADNTIGQTDQGINTCNSPNNTITGNLIGSNTRRPGAPDFGVELQGISAESLDSTQCGGQNGAATGNVIGGSPGQGNVVIGSQLDDVAVDADGNNVSYNTLRGTKGGAGLQIDGSNNQIGNNTITGAKTGGPSTPGNGVEVDSGTGNTISQNSIHGNAFLGIDLGGDGITRTTRRRRYRRERPAELPGCRSQRRRSATPERSHGRWNPRLGPTRRTGRSSSEHERRPERQRRGSEVLGTSP